MLLHDKTAVIYGGGGAIGGAVARAFAREGARVFLAGRTRDTLDRVADQIASDGGWAETAAVDALDESAVDAHADAVAASAGGIDITLNAVGIPHVQGPPFAELSFEDFAHPIAAYTRTNFLTAKAVARHQAQQGSGVILTLSTSGSRLAGRDFWATASPAARSRRSRASWRASSVPAGSASSAYGRMRFPRRSRRHTSASSSTGSPSARTRPWRTGSPSMRTAPPWDACPLLPKSLTTPLSWRPIAPAR